MQARLESLAPATAQKNINLQVLRDVAIALPPELEQDEIVNNMDASLSIAANVALSIENVAMKSRWLRRSILRQAFTGELS
jgi:type I restriction enzyme S subunit